MTAPLTVRLAARVLDAAFYPLVVLVRAWDAADTRLCDPFRGAPWNDDREDVR